LMRRARTILTGKSRGIRSGSTMKSTTFRKEHS
jgi:hypothetical protein